MRNNRKNGILGLSATVLVFSFVFAVFTTSGLSQSQVVQRSAFVEVEYKQQARTLYCGPASVQIVLETILDEHVSQGTLRDEVNYVPGRGTKNTNIVKPFQSRDITVISCGPYRTQRHLRRSIENGYYSIFNIRFDQESNYGHYVVVVGFNESGFFVDDPWPEKWSTPVGRHSGENAYITNELLNELWAFRRNWVLTVSGEIVDSTVDQDQEGFNWS